MYQFQNGSAAPPIVSSLDVLIVVEIRPGWTAVSRDAREQVADFPLVFGRRGACPQTEAVVGGFENVAVMRRPVEQSRGHLGIPEHAGPLAEAEVSGDDHACLLEELAEQMEQQRNLAGQEPRSVLQGATHRLPRAR